MRITQIHYGAVLVAAAVIAALPGLPAAAQSAEEFYKGRSVTLIVGSGAGGGYDTYSRLLARHLPRHIPGQPNFVVQNMPGASGLTALNHLYNIAAKDGSVFGDAYSSMPLYTLLDGTNAKFDALKLQWLGSISRQTSVCVSWHTSSFKTIEDAVARPMKLSATGATGWRVIMPRVYNVVGGTKFEVVMGYDTGSDYLAIERGEVDGGCTTYDTLQATKKEWLEQKKLTFLAQFGQESLPGLEAVPLGLDRIKDPANRAAADLILAQQETGRPYVFPPGVPADRVKAMRDAFDATMKDPTFLAEAQRANLSINTMTAAEMERLLKTAYASSPETVQRARAILAQAAKN